VLLCILQAQKMQIQIAIHKGLFISDEDVEQISSPHAMSTSSAAFTYYEYKDE
jgi:hypothetical protein